MQSAQGNLMTGAIEHLTLNDTVTYNLFFRILKDKK